MFSKVDCVMRVSPIPSFSALCADTVPEPEPAFFISIPLDITRAVINLQNCTKHSPSLEVSNPPIRLSLHHKNNYSELHQSA